MNLVEYFDVEPGDLDMDGYVTGHDAAMATRFLYVDPTLLTKDRQILGDMNGDGVFDQADADLIHEKQTYASVMYGTAGNQKKKRSAPLL